MQDRLGRYRAMGGQARFAVMGGVRVGRVWRLGLA